MSDSFPRRWGAAWGLGEKHVGQKLLLGSG